MTIADRIADLSMIWKQASLVFPYFDQRAIDWDTAYKEYLPKDYQCEDVITYQWNQNREYNLQGQFNFYFSIAKESISRGSMFVYLALLLTIGIIGNLASNYIYSLIGRIM